MRSRRGNGDAPVDPPVAGLVRCAQSADHSRRVSLVRAERAGVASPPSARLRLFFRGQPAAASLADTDCATPSPCPARLDIPCPGGARPLHPDHVCRRLEGLRSAELSRDPPMAYRMGRSGAPPRFEQTGILGHVRHPWYSGGIALLWALPQLTDASLIIRTLLTVYLIVGTLLEERKLRQSLGEPYRAYCREVPMLIPWKLFRR